MNKISVIVPFFNGASTLDRCIKSILKQTYKNFELLLINDGSLDNSAEVAGKYTYIDKRVKLFTKDHAGVSAARNFGLDISTGDLIQFVDADDFIEPEMFETMVGTMEKTGADIVVCNHDHPCIMNYLGNALLDVTKKDDLLTYYQNTFAAHLPWNKLFKKEVITDKFNETIGFCEDGMFGLANMKNAKKIASVDKVLYHYYVAPPSDDPNELSCINKMAKAEDFWQTKNTFWYMRDALVPISLEILKKHFDKKDIEDFLYIRIFDFMIWEIIILGTLDVDEYGLTREMQNIFAEEDFHKSLRAKEKYGVKFTDYENDGRNDKVAKFVSLSLKAIKDIRDGGKNIRTFNVVLDLFTALFIEAEEKLNTVDFVAKSALDIRTLSTEEAKYAKNLLH